MRAGSQHCMVPPAEPVQEKNSTLDKLGVCRRASTLDHGKKGAECNAVLSIFANSCRQSTAILNSYPLQPQSATAGGNTEWDGYPFSDVSRKGEGVYVLRAETRGPEKVAEWQFCLPKCGKSAEKDVVLSNTSPVLPVLKSGIPCLQYFITLHCLRLLTRGKIPGIVSAADFIVTFELRLQLHCVEGLLLKGEFFLSTRRSPTQQSTGSFKHFV